MIQEKANYKIYDALSAVMAVLIIFFSFPKLISGPQFIDGYYHLSCAQAFIKSGGWVGVDWWSVAPSLRPQLYPPVYHIIIAALKLLGFSGLTALGLTEFLIVPLFFLCFYFILRKQASPVIACYFLLLSMSFFSFFASISAFIPASLAIIFGMLSWYFSKIGKIVSAILFLGLSFYTHAAMSYIIFFSFIFTAIFNRTLRLSYLKIAGYSFLLAAPFLAHIIKNFGHISIALVEQAKSCRFSIFIIVLGISAVFSVLKKIPSNERFFFAGYSIAGLIIFFKYPFRFFSAQGILGFIYFGAYFLSDWQMRLAKKYKNAGGILSFIIIFFLHPTVDLNGAKAEINILNSTYINLASGISQDDVNFKTLYYPDMFDPLQKAVKEQTDEQDILSADSEFVAQILAALTGRLSAKSAFKEVDRRLSNPYSCAKVIVWAKDNAGRFSKIREKLKLRIILETETHYLFSNPNYSIRVVPLKSKISFKIIFALVLAFLIIFCVDILNLRKIFFRQLQSGNNSKSKK
ncbi:MAG: hypothetical protein HY810_05660 [Candidatus Omnitrophica bacterium]|nr:hypothetical protein [Candidatus Omnitrophota bacterium]